MTKQYGDPVLTVRIPREKLAMLKLLARQEQTTVTEILRPLIDQRLEESHIQPPTTTIPGQITSTDLGV